jgi:uncharacterized protein YxeA
MGRKKVVVALLGLVVVVGGGGLIWLTRAGHKAEERVVQTSRPAATAPLVEITVDPKELAYEALAGNDWMVRDEAQRWLMSQPASTREEVEKALMKTTDPEVKARLYAVVLHLFLKADTPFVGEAGLLGVSLSPEALDDDGTGRIQTVIGITSMLPGFPAAEVLREGDQILALNGAKFTEETTIDQFRTAVNGNRPGTYVRLTIKRDGVMQEVQVRLAGVPEAGTVALQDFIQRRNSKAELYMGVLHDKNDGVPVTTRATKD